MGRKLLSDKACIKLHADAFEMNPIILEELRPVDGGTVPVDQRRVSIPADAGRNHLVIRLLPRPWDLDVHENDDAPVSQGLHHGVELLRRECAVVTDMNYDRIAQRLRASSLLQDGQGGLRLAADCGINIGAWYGGGEISRCPHHHRVTEDSYADVWRNAIHSRVDVARPARRNAGL
jgi:hypothetical protein